MESRECNTTYRKLVKLTVLHHSCWKLANRVGFHWINKKLYQVTPVFRYCKIWKLKFSIHFHYRKLLKFDHGWAKVLRVGLYAPWAPMLEKWFAWTPNYSWAECHMPNKIKLKVLEFLWQRLPLRNISVLTNTKGWFILVPNRQTLWDYPSVWEVIRARWRVYGGNAS